MYKAQATLQRENQAGAYIRLKEGRVVRTSHDPAKMTAVGKSWVNYMWSLTGLTGLRLQTVI